MKKLLSLLSSLTLIVTASTTVIACSNDKDSDKTPSPSEEIEYSDLEKSIHELFEIITQNVQVQNQSKFLKVVNDDPNQQDDGYELLNLTKLNSFFSDNEAETIFDVQASTEKTTITNLLLSDLSRLFPTESWSDQIANNIAKNTSLRNLYTGSVSQTLSEFTINDNAPFKITKQSIASSSNSDDIEQIFSLNFSYSKSFFYYGQDGKSKETYKTAPRSISLTIGTEGNITNLLAKITTELPSIIFSSPSNLNTQFTKAELQTQETNFKAYGDVSPSIASYVTSTTFSQSLFQQINTIINTYLSANLNQSTWNVNADAVSVDSNMFGNTTSYASSQFWVDFQNNPLINSLVLKKSTNSAYFTYDNAKGFIGQSINSFQSNITIFKQNLSAAIDVISGLSATDKANIVKTSYSYGGINVDGLTIDLEDENTSLVVPTFSIPWTYSNSDDPELDQTQDYIQSLYDAVKAINQNLMQFGEQPNTTMLDLNDQTKTTMLLLMKYQNNSIGNIDNLAKILAANDTTYRDFIPTDNMHILSSNQDHPLLNVNSYNFNNFDSFFTIYSYDNKTDTHIEKLQFKKTSDGRIGLGFKAPPSDEDLNSITIEYKLVVGNTRIQVRLPFSSQTYNRLDTSNIDLTINDSNIFGANELSESAYKAQVQANWADFLFFQLN